MIFKTEEFKKNLDFLTFQGSKCKNVSAHSCLFFANLEKYLQRFSRITVLTATCFYKKKKCFK